VVKVGLDLDPGEKEQEARDLQLMCKLSDKQVMTCSSLSLTRYDQLYHIMSATNGNDAAIKAFLDKCANEPQGVILKFPTGSRVDPRQR
jgi:hypothetical protein